MSGQSILLWLFVGLVAGWLASVVLGGGFGLIGDILVGIVGSFIGGPVFHALGIRVPFGGIAGLVTTAFVGALVLLLAIRVVRRILGTG